MALSFDLFYEFSVPEALGRGEHAMLDDLIEQCILADALSFDTAWMVEHHRMPEFSHASSPDLILAAIAARTQRLRVGLGVVPMAYHHPLRVAQRVNTLDLLAHGRLQVGVGRGFAPDEYPIFGARIEESRERVEAGLKVLRQAWSTGHTSADGPFHHFERLPVLPRAYPRHPAIGTSPHPPLWSAAVSPESFEWSARQGLGALAGPFKPWFMVRDDIQRYRDACCEPLADDVAPESINRGLGMTLGIFVLPDGRRARRESRAAFEWFYRRLFEQTKPVLERLVQGYEHYRALGRFRALAGLGIRLRLLEALGMVLVGTPDEIIDRLKRLEDAGVDRVLLAFGAGAMPQPATLESMRCFAERVMPAFDCSGLNDTTVNTRFASTSHRRPTRDVDSRSTTSIS